MQHVHLAAMYLAIGWGFTESALNVIKRHYRLSTNEDIVFLKAMSYRDHKFSCFQYCNDVSECNAVCIDKASQHLVCGISKTGSRANKQDATFQCKGRVYITVQYRREVKQLKVKASKTSRNSAIVRGVGVRCAPDETDSRMTVMTRKGNTSHLYRYRKYARKFDRLYSQDGRPLNMFYVSGEIYVVFKTRIDFTCKYYQLTRTVFTANGREITNAWLDESRKIFILARRNGNKYSLSMYGGGEEQHFYIVKHASRPFNSVFLDLKPGVVFFIHVRFEKPTLFKKRYTDLKDHSMRGVEFKVRQSSIFVYSPSMKMRALCDVQQLNVTFDDFTERRYNISITKTHPSYGCYGMGICEPGILTIHTGSGHFVTVDAIGKFTELVSVDNGLSEEYVVKIC